MSCNDIVTPCQPCADCDCVEIVPCDEVNYTDTGCQDIISFRCVEYDNDALSCIGVLKYDTGDTVLSKINGKICQMDIPIIVSNDDGTLNIQQAGYNNTTIVIDTILSSTAGNMIIKDDGLFMRLLLTTTGDSGASTLIGTTLNIPTYTLAGLGGVPLTRLLTINGSALDLSADRAWTIAVTGTANRIAVSGGTGLTPTIDIASTYVGQTSITTLGTITTGTWQGTPIANAYLANSSITINTGTGLSGGGALALGGTLNLVNTAPDQTVVLSNGTAISVTGTYPNFTITNTAPDRTVVLSNGAGISVTGTYPNFTIASTITQYTDAMARAALSAGTGISYNNVSGVISNLAPDQTVTLTNNGGVTITGTY